MHLELKLGPPALRNGIVDRKRLVDRLVGSRGATVTIVAPAGYGKSTLMAQWREREERPTAWLSLDQADNDPATLLAGLVEALARADLVEPMVVTDTGSPSIISDGVFRVARAVAERGRDGVLMIDHIEAVRRRAAIDLIAELAAQLPPILQLVLSSRSRVRLPTGRLRSQGRLLEIQAPDLAMDDSEGYALLEAAGVDAGPDLAELMTRTEGWPVGLYLAALAVNAGAPRSSVLQIGGDDRYVTDYLRHEVLSRLSAGRVAFLTRTSVLEQFCGPMCDAVLDRTGSSRVLEVLEESNLLIVPLDRTREWYRYHHLFRDMLRSELRRREPELVASLHGRAAAWCEEHGLAELAIGHAMEADDGDTIARLVASAGRESYSAGMAEKTFSWITWFETRGTLGRYPSIAVLGAWLFALSGDPERAARWADSVTDSDGNVPGLPDEIGAVATLLRALLCADGPGAMATDSATAAGRLSGSPWYSPALLLVGVAAVLQGRFEEADTVLARSAEVGVQLAAAPAASIAFAERAALAIDRQDWDDADALVARALALIADHQLEGYSTSALAYAVGCRTAIHRGDIEAARKLLTQAAIIRPRLSWAIPHLSIQALLEQAHAYIEMSDVAGARRVVREASAILGARPDLGTLADRLSKLKTHLATLPVGRVGVSSLTSAELRLLPLLVTHLTFREIGERLFVSRHTVKTQAMSIYRKLGASSRSDAVATARDTGLLTS